MGLLSHQQSRYHTVNAYLPFTLASLCPDLPPRPHGCQYISLDHQAGRWHRKVDMKGGVVARTKALSRVIANWRLSRSILDGHLSPLCADLMDGGPTARNKHFTEYPVNRMHGRIRNSLAVQEKQDPELSPPQSSRINHLRLKTTSPGFGDVSPCRPPCRGQRVLAAQSYLVP